MSSFRLTDAALGSPMRVLAVHADPAAPDWADRLAEIGFLPGEAVAVMARFQPGGDPLSVRVGLSTFALRRAEASLVEVEAAPVGVEAAAFSAPGR